MHKSKRQHAARHAACLAAPFACLSRVAAQELPAADAWQFEFISYLGTLEARRGPWGALLDMQCGRVRPAYVIDSSVAVDVLAGGRFKF